MPGWRTTHSIAFGEHRRDETLDRLDDMKRVLIGLVLGCLLLASRIPAAAELPQRTAMNRHLTENDSTRDILQHPAFAGFAERILPRPGDAHGNTPLNQIGSLLPYHTHVIPREVVGGLNRLIDDAASGQAVFYDIYPASDRQHDPAKRHTGLFFFRGPPGAPFAVIAPGGGFAYVGSLHEGFPHALEINRKGYHAFVLAYRVGQGGAVATQDLAVALSWIFRNAGRLGVSTSGYSVWGSSAGARMAAAIGTHGVQQLGGDALPRPAAVVMAYTGHSDHSRSDPPTYVVVGEDDRIAPPSVMERRVAALRDAGIRVEYREVAKVGHGFGLGTGTAAQGWVGEAVEFWRSVRAAPGPER
jgi:acetyl esterase/lipase